MVRESKKQPSKATPLVMLTRTAILAAKDRTSTIVHVPEWGGSVMVMTMTGTDRDAWENSLFNEQGDIVRQENARATLISKCLVDEAGDLMFSEDTIAELGSKSSAALDRVFAACQKVCGIGVEAVDAAEKNS